MFAHMGLRHNDCHSNNVRIVPSTSDFKLAYHLKKKVVYCKTKHLAVINDFDRMGVEQPMKNVTQMTNPCTKTPDGFYCDGLNQCDRQLEGRRDLLIFMYYVYNMLPQQYHVRKYVFSTILAPNAWALQHFEKYIRMSSDGNIDYQRSYSHEFLFINLTDQDVLKYYRPIDDVLNDDAFIGMFLGGKNHNHLADYEEFSFYNVSKKDLYDKYTQLVNQQKV